jgi:hypothetical protein
MKNVLPTRTPRGPLSAVAVLGVVFFGWLSAPAQAQTTPTNTTVTNASNAAVYANLTLGQPPTTPPANCTNLGQQIQSIADPRLVFTSSITNQNISFTPQTPGATELGYYQLAPGETITYQPQTSQCSTGTCSPAVTFNFLFTPNVYDGSPNNGCGGSVVFPNSSTIAEASINFGINGSVGSGCAAADATDISAVNGINSSLGIVVTGGSWNPMGPARNRWFGQNADLPGVYGWAATNCTNSAGFPNPGAGCPAPNAAPVPINGQCRTPSGTSYSPINFADGPSYCDERSDPSSSYPMGQCVIQRPSHVSGGTVAITFTGLCSDSTCGSANSALVAAVLPESRSVEVGSSPATAFATIINVGPGTASGCAIAPQTVIPASFVFQTADPKTDALTGTANTPVDIAEGASQSFVIALTPTAAFPPNDIDFSFTCANGGPVAVLAGVNTLNLSASTTPVPDIVALAASSDPGYVDISGATGTGVFAVATINLGIAASITASANIGTANLPVGVSLCQTNPITGTCLATPASTVTTTIAANATPTFGIFVTASATVADSPGANRVFVQFTDASGVLHGETSVAVRTQ